MLLQLFQFVVIFTAPSLFYDVLAEERDGGATVEIQQSPVGNGTPEVQIAVADIPLYFSPYAMSPLEAQYAHLFFDPLVRWSTHKELEKRLVSGWLLLKPGVIRFFLKKEISFHSGNKLSSDDVIWTLDQIRKTPHAKAFFTGILKIEKVDQHSFDLHTDLSEDQLLDYLAHFFVLDHAFYESHNITMNNSQDIVNFNSKTLPISGSGPYKINQYNPLLHLRVVSNDKYWGETNVIAGFNFIRIHSANSRLYALLAEDVDICESMAKKDIDTVSHAPSKKLVEISSSEVVFLTISDKRSNVFKRRVARDAVALSINKMGMLKHIVNNLGSVKPYFTAQQNIGDKENKELLEYDARTARNIFSKITMPAELHLLVLVDKAGNTAQIARALLNMMQKVSIKLTITEVSDLQKWNAMSGDYDFTLSSWQFPLLNRDNIYQHLFTDSPLSQYIDALFAESLSDNTLASKISLFEQSQESQWIMPLLFLNTVWASDDKYDLASIFSINSIPYWHLLTVNKP
ncbi:ABC transporter substrate-binding protein [Psychromonas sp. MME1]|uniref:ABC transporter substrate-binding protein n=1 Tax=Psychromonas sp. MME1 TaxID=3231032 RepID=UPI0034E19A7B